MNNKLLTVSEVAEMLGLAEETVKCDVTRRPHTLPPRVVFPGSRRVRWRKQDVEQWIEQHVTT